MVAAPAAAPPPPKREIPSALPKLRLALGVALIIVGMAQVVHAPEAWYLGGTLMLLGMSEVTTQEVLPRAVVTSAVLVLTGLLGAGMLAYGLHLYWTGGPDARPTADPLIMVGCMQLVLAYVCSRTRNWGKQGGAAPAADTPRAKAD